MIDHKKSYISREVEYILPITNKYGYYSYVRLTGIICKIYNKYSVIKPLNVIHDGSSTKYYEWACDNHRLLRCSNIYLNFVWSKKMLRIEFIEKIKERVRKNAFIKQQDKLFPDEEIEIDKCLLKMIQDSGADLFSEMPKCSDDYYTLIINDKKK